MITGKFSDWEWDETISFYYKDGDVYFVFIVDNSVAGIRELRVYFDKRGRLIRLLEKSNIESPGGEMCENKRINDHILKKGAYVKKILNE